MCEHDDEKKRRTCRYCTACIETEPVDQILVSGHCHHLGKQQQRDHEKRHKIDDKCVDECPAQSQVEVKFLVGLVANFVKKAKVRVIGYVVVAEEGFVYFPFTGDNILIKAEFLSVGV